MKKYKSQKGITLVALIVTIALLLLIASITISTIHKEGLIEYANNAEDIVNTTITDKKDDIDDLENFLDDDMDGNTIHVCVYNQKNTNLKNAIITKASCLEEGSYYYSCKCGAIGTDIFYVDRLAHKYNQENTNKNFLKSAATCTSPAIYYKSCVCWAKGTNTFEYGSALGHTYTPCQISGCLVKHNAYNCERCKVYYYDVNSNIWKAGTVEDIHSGTSENV